MNNISHTTNGHRKRLKERFTDKGFDSLLDYEQLELLLTYSIPRRDVKPLAKDLINKFQNLRGVIDASDSELKKVNGIGDNTITLLKLIKELHSDYLRSKIYDKNYNFKISSPNDVYSYLKIKLGNEEKELFMLLLLNNSNNIIFDKVIAQGTINRATVYTREVVELCIKENAVNVIIVHNHPSGNMTPSESDIELTKSINKALKTVQISLLDHIIISSNDEYSFLENGLI